MAKTSALYTIIDLNDGDQLFTRYGISNSNITIPSTWNASEPAPAANIFVWREEGHGLTFETADWGDPICLTGNQGATGEPGDAAPNIISQYSINGSTSWHSPFVLGDKYMQTSNDNGSTWSAVMKIVGEAGTNGSYVNYEFTKNTSTTVAPTSGWQDAPPTINTGEYLWMRKQTVDSSGTAGAWSTVRISGEKGATGEPGPVGPNGLPSYFHTAWANNSTGTSDFSKTVSTGKLYIGTYSDSTLEDSSDPTKYAWVKVKGEQGIQGPTGNDGADGQDFNHYKGSWNISSDGVGYDFSFPPVPNGMDLFEVKIYQKDLEQSVRILCNGNVVTSAINGANEIEEWKSFSINSSFVNFDDNNIIRIEHISGASADWGYIYEVIFTYSKKGEKGENGIQGPVGPDGQTSYFHTAWANNSTGTSGFSTTVSTDKLYIGTYSDFVLADSSDPTKYTWVKIKGETGPTGAPGDAAPNIISQYSINGSTSWHSPFVLGDKYMQTSNDNGSTWSAVMKIVGENGVNGDDGINGSYVNYEFSKNTSTTTAPTTGWQDSPPSINTGEYLWMRKQTVDSNGTPGAWSTVRISGDKGDPGADGDNAYIHTAWANSSDGATGFSTADSFNKLYMGTYTDNSSTGSQTYSDYTWVKVKGETGADGADGSYVEYEFSKNTSTTTAPTTGWQDAPPIINTGEYLWMQKRTVDSNGTPGAWSTAVRISGEQGPQGDVGPQGPAGTPGHIGAYSNEATLYVKGFDANGILQASVGYIYVGSQRVTVTEYSDDLINDGRGYIIFDGITIKFAQLIANSSGSNWVKFDDTSTGIDGSFYVIGTFNKSGNSISNINIFNPIVKQDYEQQHFMDILANGNLEDVNTWAAASGINTVFEKIAVLEAFVNKLFANQIEISQNGHIQSVGFETGSGKGFKLSSDGSFEGRELTVDGGSFNSIDASGKLTTSSLETFEAKPDIDSTWGLATNYQGMQKQHIGQVGTTPLSSYTFAACGNSIIGVSKTSKIETTDGINWTEEAIDTTNSVAGPKAYGNGYLVIGGYQGIYRVVPGVRSIGYTRVSGVTYARSVIFGNGYFLFCGDSSAFTATNPTSWTAHSTNHLFEYAVWDGTQFVAKSIVTGGKDLITSANGYSWTIKHSFLGGTITSIVYENGYYFVALYNKTIHKSTDLINWTEMFALNGSINDFHVIYYGGIWYMNIREYNGDFGLKYSTDLVNWMPIMGSYTESAGFYDFAGKLLNIGSQYMEQITNKYYIDPITAALTNLLATLTPPAGKTLPTTEPLQFFNGVVASITFGGTTYSIAKLKVAPSYISFYDTLGTLYTLTLTDGQTANITMTLTSITGSGDENHVTALIPKDGDNTGYIGKDGKKFKEIYATNIYSTGTSGEFHGKCYAT